MKFSRLFLLAVSICTVTFSIAQDFNPIEKHYFSDDFEIPNFIEFGKDEMPGAEDLDKFLYPYWKGKSDFDLRLKDRFVDQQGEVHLKYVQTYKGVDIEFAEWMVHLNNGMIRAMNGKLITEYPSVGEASISEANALAAAKNFIGADVYKWEIPAEEEFIKAYEKDPNASFFPKAEMKYMSGDLSLLANKLRLCYTFNIYAHEPMSRQEVYIDANTSEVIFSNDLIHTINDTGIAITGYSGVQNIITDSFANNRYRLQQTVMGNGVATFDLNNATNFNSAVDFIDSNNIWNHVNTQKDQYATDAHWGAEKTYEYFNVNFGRNSINNNGFALNSYVHYANNFVNAFWNGQWMTYGDGNNQVTPLTSLDIAGHEIAHGLTTFSANLIYARESGALNESFSDIFGAAIEFYARPNQANWTLGEDIGLILRNMANPKQYSDPDTYGGTFWLSQIGCVPSNQNDNCGVHINSGVQNYWFHLISTGGTGVNDNSQSYTVPSIGLTKAAAIAYRNLTVYLGRSSDFNEARYYSIRSAIDLYGACSPEVESVTKAWYAVGVGANYVNTVIADFSTADTLGCITPFNVSFEDNSVNAISYLWNFGDGNTSTNRNPIHTYTSNGLYDVTLFVNGGTCGNDTLVRTAYIDIDTANTCAILLNNGSNPTQSDCNGKIYDSGGASGNYADNELGTLTIDVPGASSITLTFNSFNVEAGSLVGVCDYDYLEVFDGPNTNSASLGKFCNNVTPPSSISSSRGVITLRFRSDQGLNLPGFDIDWSCTYPTAAPTTNFSWSNDTTCTGEIAFTDKSTQAPTSWFWDFGDGTTSPLRDPVHTYLIDGTYSVSLISTNSFGSDTITKSSIVHVDRPAGPMVISDTTCAGQTATLTASGNGRLDWYADQFAGTSVNSGGTFTLNQPQSDTTFWVEDYIQPAVQVAGAPSNAFGTGGNYNGDQYLVFDVFKTLVLTDVFVYATGNGTRTIELRDNTGTVLQSKTLNVSNGLFNVDLDFLIEPGTDYQLGIDYQGTGPNLYRNSSGASYPYTLPGMLSIKRSSATSNPTAYYYFFYYWRVKEPDCISPRVPVTAKVDPNCGVTTLEEYDLTEQITLFPNPTADEVEILIPAHSSKLQIDMWSVDGKKVREVYQSTNSRYPQRRKVDVSDLEKGIYLTRIVSDNKSKTVRLVVL